MNALVSLETATLTPAVFSHEGGLDAMLANISLAIGIACIMASVLGLVFVGWKSGGKSLREQFDDLPRAAETPEQIARRTQA